MRLRSIGLISTLVLGLLATPLTAEAQQAGKVYRVGVLRFRGSPDHPNIQAFRQGLRDLGWVEGQNITLEYRWAKGRRDRLPELAAELVRLKVDVIVVTGNRTIRVVKKATSTIPIVVAHTGDLVGPGHAASLARPGGNITGLVTMSPDLSTKRLELLKEVVPKVSRVAVLWNAANRGKLREFKYTQTAANALRLQLQSVEVRRPDDLEHAFSAIQRERADALLLLPEGLVNSRASRIADFTLKNRLPAIHQVLSFADAGGLMVYGPNDRDLYRRAATYVDKILKGAKPGDLPIEQPTKFELVINLKTAKQLGVTIPPEMLFRADKVIK